MTGLQFALCVVILCCAVTAYVIAFEGANK